MPTIYCLKNPLKNDAVYYVGYTQQTLPERLMNHIATSKQETTKQLSINGILPIIEVIEDGASITKQTELYWIKKYKEDGCQLENIDGLVNYQNRGNLFLSKEKIMNMEEMNKSQLLKYSLELIMNELPLSSSTPIVLRIKNIIETCFSMLGESN